MSSYLQGRIVCNDHVALQSVCLKTSEELAISGHGLFLMFPTAGGGEWWNGTRAQPLGPGDVFLVNAKTMGSLRLANGDSMVFSYFSLGVEHLWAICATAELCFLESVMERLKNPRRHLNASPIAQKCVNLLRDVPPEHNLEHRSQLLRVAAVLLGAEFQEALPQRCGYARNEEHLLQVLERLPVSDIMDLPSDELAAKFSCSRRQLNRWFQRFFGQSAGTLRMEMRLLRAASLLRGSDAKVISVAEQTGFRHLGLFNTCFKRRFGVSPSEWRVKASDSESQFANLMDGDCVLRAQGLCAWVDKTAPDKDPRSLRTGSGIARRSRESSAPGSAGRPVSAAERPLSTSPVTGNGAGKSAPETPIASVTPSGITFRVRV